MFLPVVSPSHGMETIIARTAIGTIVGYPIELFFLCAEAPPVTGSSEETFHPFFPLAC